MRLPSTKGKGFLQTIKPLFTNNTGLKVFSFLCALLLYSIVHSTQDAQRIMAVDLFMLMPPETANRTLLTEPPTSVRVSLHGPRSLIDDLTPSSLGNLQLDLRSGRSGRFPLDPSMLHVPGGVAIDFIDPPALDVAWDEVVERDIAVQVSVTGEPAPGDTVKGIPSAEPRTIRARGPRQIVDNLQFARAEPFDVTGLREGIHQRALAIDRPPSRVTYDTASIKATVEVTRKLLERIFSKVHVQVVGSSRAAAIPPRVDIRVVGPPDRVEALRIEQLVPRANLQDVDVNLSVPNSIELPVQLELDGLQTTVIPKTVIVKW